ncbi:hypothetical protein [Desulfovibrio psychrotolerans]|nr:hypothetical protein [Desulfovibrio psychrotolerans]
MDRLLQGTTLQAFTLPFSGLGHDLAPCEERAGVMALAPVQRRAKPHSPARTPFGRVESLPAVSGYGLLVTLGREIRGR